MENRVMMLMDLPMGQRAQVLSLLFDGAARRRMLDLGLIEGTEIAALFPSPSGSPVAYGIRGAVIALRDDIASEIMVREC